MIESLRTWYQALAPRERIAVVVGGIVVIIAVFYYALWQPLNSSLESARQQVVSKTNQTRWMLGVRDQARRLRANGTPTQLKGRGDSLLSIVDETSRANGLGDAVRHIQPGQDGKATVNLQQANFNQMLFWLQTLQQDYGIRASEITLSRDDDTPGNVEARLTLLRNTG